MIFADKLIQLRKKSGWSQEELAEQMGVSRQSISKWEGAQSIPDLEKIIRLAKLFSVSTDYLLLDEMGEPEGGAPALPGKDIPALRRISMEEANAFLKIKEETARYIAWGVFLCILSPIVLLMLGGFSEMPGSGISEGLAAAIGLTVLLVMVAAAVAIFVYSGGRTSPFEYLDSQGNPQGFDIDYAKYLCATMGYELEIENMNFDALPAALQTGQVDFLCAGLSVTEERLLQMDFTDNYYESTQAIVVLK